MKKLTNHIIFILVMTTLTSGCQKIVDDVTPPQIESQLVVFSFLSPDEDFIKVEVSVSRPVFGKIRSRGGVDYVKNASVVITDDAGVSATLLFNDSFENYWINQSSYPILPGKKYTVTVLANGKAVSGSCIVPQSKVVFNEVSYKDLTNNGSPNSFGPYYIYTYNWNDEPSVKNYYRVSIEKTYEYTFMNDTQSYTNEVCNSLRDDSNKEGAQLAGSCEDYSYYFNEADTTGEEVFVTLLNTDIHYFEYHKRRINYSSDDPFSEPNQQYNNVQGGYGVVCAYRKSRTTLLIK